MVGTLCYTETYFVALLLILFIYCICLYNFLFDLVAYYVVFGISNSKLQLRDGGGDDT